MHTNNVAFVTVSRKIYNEVEKHSGWFNLLVRMSHVYVAEEDGSFTVIKDRSGTYTNKQTITVDNVRASFAEEV